MSSRGPTTGAGSWSPTTARRWSTGGRHRLRGEHGVTFAPVTGGIDGRTARSMRTKAAIVDACLALVDAGDLRPTAPRVAEKAGVSVRSVFQHFADLDSLFAAVGDEAVSRLKNRGLHLDPDEPVG